MIHDTQSAQTSKQFSLNIYLTKKTMFPTGHHHNCFIVTHALCHMIYGYIFLVKMNQRMLSTCIMLLAWLVEHSLWFIGTSKLELYIMCWRAWAMSYHKAIVVINDRACHIVFIIVYVNIYRYVYILYIYILYLSVYLSIYLSI